MVTIKRYAEKYNAKVKEWQKRQRDLMRENDFLTRDYQRENAQKLAYDLGFRLENKDLILTKKKKLNIMKSMKLLMNLYHV